MMLRETLVAIPSILFGALKSIFLLHFLGFVLFSEIFLVSPERMGQPGFISDLNKTQSAHTLLKLAHAIYRDVFQKKIKKFDCSNIFAQNTHFHCGYMSTHNVCFGSNIRKLAVFLFKSGV